MKSKVFHSICGALNNVTSFIQANHYVLRANISAIPKEVEHPNKLKTVLNTLSDSYSYLHWVEGAILELTNYRPHAFVHQNAAVQIFGSHVLMVKLFEWLWDDDVHILVDEVL